MSAPAPPTSRVNCWPALTAIVPADSPAPPPEPTLLPTSTTDPPWPPSTVARTEVTPVGTVQVCSAPVEPKATVHRLASVQDGVGATAAAGAAPTARIARLPPVSVAAVARRDAVRRADCRIGWRIRRGL